MKSLLIVIGSVLFFVSVIGFIVPIFGNQHSILQSYNLCGSVLGTIGQAFSGEVQENCNNVNSYLVPLVLAGLVGFVLLIVGLIKK